MEKYRKLTSYNKGMKWIVYEKIDGSNVSFIKDEEGKLTFFSRNRELKNIETEKVFSKLLGLYDTEFYQNMHVGVIYFGELLGMAKIKYNKTLNTKPLNEQLFIFDMFKDGEYYTPKEFLNVNLCEFSRPKFEIIDCDLKAVHDFIEKEDVISEVDGESLIEGYVVKSFYSNAICFKKVNTLFAEGMRNQRKETVEPNQRYFEKWVQKWVYEEPITNLKAFKQECKKDFETENPGVKMATNMIVPLIVKYDLAQIVYKDITFTRGDGIEESKQIPVGIAPKE